MPKNSQVGFFSERNLVHRVPMLGRPSHRACAVEDGSPVLEVSCYLIDKFPQWCATGDGRVLEECRFLQCGNRTVVFPRLVVYGEVHFY